MALISRYNTGRALGAAALLVVGSTSAMAASDNGGAAPTNSQAMSTSDTSPQPTESTTAPTPRVAAADQAIKQDTVLFSQLQIPEAGWVVLHPGNGHGQMDPTRTIGQKHLSSGMHENTTVHLNAPVAVGDRIYAMLHQDTGQAGTYEYHDSRGDADQPLMYQGHHVMTSFRVVKPATHQPSHVPASTAKPGVAGPSNGGEQSSNDNQSAGGSGQSG
ncbi:hypothetical protein [Salinisphaera sp. Q1T1-3]|uniref:DUF7282 domain-containing protein n=1 Tax=Salinisphaera sp. Q1T1-3 TaxID=2321229 RepID=UPI000E70D8C0|nr:hypothetical protein [Salinisphaera sp. Q1T1-3]RJS94311.1 hypothetical protein D3260_04165 [Salinisphaera sp. Q1T1-3]